MQGWGQGHQAVTAPLAADLEGELPALGLPQILDPEPQQRTKPNAAIGQDSDDQFVPLRLGDVLHLLDLLPAEHVEQPLLGLG
jgi:hypothetical protein